MSSVTPSFFMTKVVCLHFPVYSPVSFLQWSSVSEERPQPQVTNRPEGRPDFQTQHVVWVVVSLGSKVGLTRLSKRTVGVPSVEDVREGILR